MGVEGMIELYILCMLITAAVFFIAINKLGIEYFYQGASDEVIQKVKKYWVLELVFVGCLVLSPVMMLVWAYVLYTKLMK